MKIHITPTSNQFYKSLNSKEDENYNGIGNGDIENNKNTMANTNTNGHTHTAATVTTKAAATTKTATPRHDDMVTKAQGAIQQSNGNFVAQGSDDDNNDKGNTKGSNGKNAKNTKKPKRNTAKVIGVIIITTASVACVGFGLWAFINSMTAKPTAHHIPSAVETKIKREADVYIQNEKENQEAENANPIVKDATALDPKTQPVRWDLYNSLIGFHTNGGHALNLSIVAVDGDNWSHPIIYRSTPYAGPRDDKDVMMPSFTTQAERVNLTINQTTQFKQMISKTKPMVEGDGIKVWNSEDVWNQFQEWNVQMSQRQARFARTALEGAGWDTDIMRKTDYKTFAKSIDWNNSAFDHYRYGGVYATRTPNGKTFYFTVIGVDKFRGVRNGDEGNASYWNSKIGSDNAIETGIAKGTINMEEIYKEAKESINNEN